MRRLVLAMLALTALGAGGGCQAVRPLGSFAPGVTGYSYAEGAAAQRFTYPAYHVRRAAIEAMQDMGMHSVQETPTGEDGCVLAGSLYDGRCVEVVIQAFGETSHLNIRIDRCGDEPASKIFIDRTSARLATLLPPLNPVFAPRAYTDSVLHRGQDVAGYRGTPLR